MLKILIDFVKFFLVIMLSTKELNLVNVNKKYVSEMEWYRS